MLPALSDNLKKLDKDLKEHDRQLDEVQKYVEAESPAHALDTLDSQVQENKQQIEGLINEWKEKSGELDEMRQGIAGISQAWPPVSGDIINGRPIPNPANPINDIGLRRSRPNTDTNGNANAGPEQIIQKPFEFVGGNTGIIAKPECINPPNVPNQQQGPFSTDMSADIPADTRHYAMMVKDQIVNCLQRIEEVNMQSQTREQIIRDLTRAHEEHAQRVSDQVRKLKWYENEMRLLKQDKRRRGETIGQLVRVIDTIRNPGRSSVTSESRPTDNNRS